MDAADRKQLENAGLDEIIKIADQIDQSPQTDETKAVGNNFAELAKNNKFALFRLNGQLRDNPDLSKKIIAAIKANPNGFNQALPSIFKSPSKVSQIVAEVPLPAESPRVVNIAPDTQTHAAKPVEPDQRQAAVKPTAETPIHQPGGLVVAAENQQEQKPRTDQPSNQQQSTPSTGANDSVETMLDELGQRPGFNELMKTVQENPALVSLLGGNFGDSKNPGANAGLYKMLLDASDPKTGNPNFFANASGMLKQNSGIITTFATLASGDPKAMAQIFGMGGQQGGEDLFSKIFAGLGQNGAQGGQYWNDGYAAIGIGGGAGGFGGLNRLVGSLFSGQGPQAVLSGVMANLQGTKYVLEGASNDPTGGQTKAALKAVGGEDQTVTRVAVNGDVVAANETGKDAAIPGTPQQRRGMTAPVA